MQPNPNLGTIASHYQWLAAGANPVTPTPRIESAISRINIYSCVLRRKPVFF